MTYILRRWLIHHTAAIVTLMVLCAAIKVFAAYDKHEGIKHVDRQQRDVFNVNTLASLAPQPQKVNLGVFRITHYCICVKCCGKTDGITATGTKATVGRTIGVDPTVVPYGSTVYIGGQAYVAEDTGGSIKGNRIDILVESHEEAINKGVYDVEVFLYGTT